MFDAYNMSVRPVLRAAAATTNADELQSYGTPRSGASPAYGAQDQLSYGPPPVVSNDMIMSYKANVPRSGSVSTAAAPKASRT